MALEGRRQRERQNRRIDILKTALELFSERGYSSVSMDEIAARAEFTKPTLYQYFENKADLYSSIVLELGFDFVENRLAAAAGPGLTPTEQLHRLRASFKELCLGPPRKIFLLFVGLAREEIAAELSPAMLKKMRERLSQCLKIVESVLERGMREKEFRRLDAAETTRHLWGMCVGMAQMMESDLLVGQAPVDIGALYDSFNDRYFSTITEPSSRIEKHAKPKH